MYGQRCHSAHTAPRTVLAFSAPPSLALDQWRIRAIPPLHRRRRQRTQGKRSVPALMECTAQEAGSPAKIIIQYAKNIMAGIKKMMGIYHLFFLILL